jgi:hypothetical protein
VNMIMNLNELGCMKNVEILSTLKDLVLVKKFISFEECRLLGC